MDNIEKEIPDRGRGKARKSKRAKCIEITELEYMRFWAQFMIKSQRRFVNLMEVK